MPRRTPTRRAAEGPTLLEKRQAIMRAAWMVRFLKEAMRHLADDDVRVLAAAHRFVGQVGRTTLAADDGAIVDAIEAAYAGANGKAAAAVHGDLVVCVEHVATRRRVSAAAAAREARKLYAVYQPVLAAKIDDAALASAIEAWRRDASKWKAIRAVLVGAGIETVSADSIARSWRERTESGRASDDDALPPRGKRIRPRIRFPRLAHRRARRQCRS